MPRETCMIFIDDSNVWIEAQKFVASGNSHMPKLQDSDRDPRLRIDIGKLVERLLRNRTQGLSFLYGSRPPPNDSVWKAFEKNKFETNIYDRAYGGKEKEVDNSMLVDIATKATELSMEAKLLAKHGDPKAIEKKDNTTFVVITGDRDLMPAVECVL
ncbi:c27ae5fa-a1b4-4fef-aa14-690be1f76c3d [Thermothielavioides terrestris]|uniref:C27ae5fa-a1b4-4fef-aa14-690be1f76c3d n=1 Tax=Thermothielavioides terrestris TaxID=2587410 RepID=A0A446BXD8_9PEZI|nr:c27ae5fa-a1b4-4fef-aa14-690be1f76c3d [Thermothielavioides terrestris]